MSGQQNYQQMISNEYLAKMRKDSYNLIREFSKVGISESGKSQLFLYDSALIEYREFTLGDIERFSEIVKKYGGSFFQLIRNLQSESVTRKVETDHVIGGIDFQMTRSIRQSGGNKIVCISYEKNLFTPENILLGAIILAIGDLADRFKDKRWEWDQTLTDDFHMGMLNDISEFAYFLQKDRFVSKLIRHYHENFNSIDLLLQKIQTRINSGKITKKEYKKLIEFYQICKYWDNILADDSRLDVKLPDFLQGLPEHKLYEFWLFYKMLESYGKKMKMIQCTTESARNTFSNGEYDVIFQWSKQIGWKKAGGRELDRRPDIMIRKNGIPVAIIDAKCMPGNIFLESTGEASMPSPKIVNAL